MTADQPAVKAAGTKTRAKPVRKAMRKARPGEGWTLPRRQRFLEELALSCNVRHSAAQAGMCESGAYKLRARSAAFRIAWATAQVRGYEQIEWLLMQRALGGEVRRASGAIEPHDAAVERPRLQLLSQHRGAVQATRGRSVAAPAVVVPDARPILEGKLRTMRRNLGVDDEQ